uniref:Uncharacterized protein n=1 Tax=Eucampia antarctica TaxID=49252 RepID=A0A7S2RPG7_9STRA
MGKGKKDNADVVSNWGPKDHSSRLDAKLNHLSKTCKRTGRDINEALANGYRRSRFAHDSREKWQTGKLRLNITKTKREAEIIRQRLSTWDDVDEDIRMKKEMVLEKKRKAEEEAEMQGIKKKKRGRLGPETWKLRGAARPAYEVYDFDTRYVDVHLKAHEEAKIKGQRIRNILSVYKGHFCQKAQEKESENLKRVCRLYLSLLMQLGLLNLEAKKFKTARETFMRCIELEGTDHDVPVTNARSQLMRMYLDNNRPDSARRLWEELPTDSSVWVRYSAALIEFVSWKILEEEGSNKETAEINLAKAIRSNLFCAYYIAFHDTFKEVMEYTDEVEDAENGSIEQAIEYCNSEQMGSWLGTEDAIQWIRSVLLRCIHGGEIAGEVLGKMELDWDTNLVKIESDHENKQAKSDSKKIEDDDDDDEGTAIYCSQQVLWKSQIIDTL